MAALLRNRPSVLTRTLSAILAAVVIGVPSAGYGAAAVLDAVLAEVGGAIITASDAGIAKGLGLFGLQSSPPTIGADDVHRLVDAWIIGAEAARLQIAPSSEDLEAAWQAAAGRVGGMDALRRWLDRAGLDEAWVSRLVAADLRRRRFVEVRFRAFVFVPEEALTEALGPGPHTPVVREVTVEALREEITARDLAAWLTEARTRAAIRTTRTDGAGLSPPFPLP